MCVCVCVSVCVCVCVRARARTCAHTVLCTNFLYTILTVDFQKVTLQAVGITDQVVSTVNRNPGTSEYRTSSQLFPFLR